jgi:hypothetical protein
VGLWLVWSGGTRYASDARITLTVLGAFAAVLEGWIAIVTLTF